VLARFLQTPTQASGEAIVPTLAAASSLCHGCSGESPLLLQRGAVVRRFRYCIPEEQSPAATAAAVALR